MPLEYDEVLVSGDPDALWVYAYNFEKCVVVDWREMDDEIVEYVADKIPEVELIAKWTEDEPTDLTVTYNGRQSTLGLTESPADRYIVLRGLNRIMAGEYELRVFTATLETDTHAFLVKPCSWWREMDKRFPNRMAAVFSRLTETTDFT